MFLVTCPGGLIMNKNIEAVIVDTDVHCKHRVCLYLDNIGNYEFTYKVFDNDNTHPSYSTSILKPIYYTVVSALNELQYHFRLTIVDKEKFLKELLPDVLVKNDDCIKWCNEFDIPNREECYHMYAADNLMLVYLLICEANGIKDHKYEAVRAIMNAIKSDGLW
jgi:hypothetical protein